MTYLPISIAFQTESVDSYFGSILWNNKNDTSEMTKVKIQILCLGITEKPTFVSTVACCLII